MTRKSVRRLHQVRYAQSDETMVAVSADLAGQPVSWVHDPVIRLIARRVSRQAEYQKGVNGFPDQQVIAE